MARLSWVKSSGVGSTSAYVVGVFNSLDIDRLNVWLIWVWQQVTVNVALGSQGRRNLKPAWVTL